MWEGGAQAWGEDRKGSHEWNLQWCPGLWFPLSRYSGSSEWAGELLWLARLTPAKGKGHHEPATRYPDSGQPVIYWRPLLKFLPLDLSVFLKHCCYRPPTPSTAGGFGGSRMSSLITLEGTLHLSRLLVEDLAPAEVREWGSSGRDTGTSVCVLAGALGPQRSPWCVSYSSGRLFLLCSCLPS